jgi:hypothetical protein
MTHIIIIIIIISVDLKKGKNSSILLIDLI